MKTILFLDRAPLTIMYSRMTPFMKDVNCIHVAYSKEDAEILESNGIKPDYCYLDLFKTEYDSAQYDDELLKVIDTDILEQTNNRFNLNGAIQSDRGFSLLSYDESIRSSVAHYRVWDRIFYDNHVDLVLHEPCSLFFNFICCVLCKKQGGKYLYQIESLSEKYDFSYLNAVNDDYFYPELQKNFKKYLDDNSLIDTERCKAFLDKFRKNQEAFFGGLLNRKVSFCKLLFNAFKHKIHSLLNKNKVDRIYDNVRYWMLNNNVSWKKAKNVIGYKLDGVRFVDKLPENEKFFFYPFHLEPEAVVLYLGDGIYKNQIKLIENIAASLPVGFYLYVKDHPHEYAYRESIDYKRLMLIPNVRLLNQNIPAKAIMSKAQGIITINGSAGFEATLTNKQVYCFGHNMYSLLSRVNYIENIRDLKKSIYSSLNVMLQDDNELFAYVMAYLESLHPGYTSCYTGSPFIKGHDYIGDAEMIAKDTLVFLDQL